MLARNAAAPGTARTFTRVGIKPSPLRAIRRPQSATRSVAARSSASDDVLAADVVIVGAGIVGLFTAQELLRNQLSVLLLERKGLCAGATGAGQGYLWMAHRAPGSVGWALAARSVALWRRQVAADEAFRSALEWQDCGSLLVSTTPEESASLSERQLALNGVGLRAAYLDRRRLAEDEPALVPPRGGAGLMVQSDLQINGRAAAHALLQRCREAPGFADLMGPEAEVLGLELAAAPGSSSDGGGGGGGHVVRTPGRRVHARQALVLCAGVWSGSLLLSATGQPDWAQLLQPRRGHLLELPRPDGMPVVRHGMMEMSYTKHYATAATSPGASRPAASPAAASSPSPSSPSASSPGSPAASSSAPAASQPQLQPQPADITFTATTSASGSLLIGSSRESGVWDTAPAPAIVAAILQRSALFLPGLKAAAEAAEKTAAAAAFSGGGGGGTLEGFSVRVGLRPYAVGGLPLIGPVEGAPGLFLAAGHEGSGLCMGPATGELLSRYIRKHTGASAAAAAAAGDGSGGDAAGLDTRSFEDLLPDVRRRAAAAAMAES